jgi:hypothetical protein
MNPIADYLEQLEGLLRRGRRRRLRIVAEVRAHLLDAAAAEALRGADPDSAARTAVERFGSPLRVAGQFNALARRPRTFVARASAVALACAGMATVGSASVWALEPAGAHTAVHTTVQHHHLRKHHAEHGTRDRR